MNRYSEVFHCAFHNFAASFIISETLYPLDLSLCLVHWRQLCSCYSGCCSLMREEVLTWKTSPFTPAHSLCVYVWFCPSWGNEILFIHTAPVIKKLDTLMILNRFHNLKNDYHVTPKMKVRQLRFLYDSKGLISFVIISVFLFSMVFSLLYIRFIIYQVFSIHQEKVYL